MLFQFLASTFKLYLSKVNNHKCATMDLHEQMDIGKKTRSKLSPIEYTS